MTSPAVSVVIPVRNFEKYIAEAIESVRAQQFSSWELVVVDDCSTDRTGEIAKRFAEGERIRVIRNATNLGQFPTHNRGAEMARGRYLKFLHGDDILYPHALQVMVESMDEFSEAGLGISCALGPWLAPKLFSSAMAWRAQMAGQTSMLAQGPSGTIFRTDAFRAVGGFSSRFHTGDMEMNMRTAAQFAVVAMADGLFWYRRHEAQVTSVHRREFAGEAIVWIRALLASPSCPLASGEKVNEDRRAIHGFWRELLRVVRRGEVRLAHAIWRKSGLPLRMVRLACLPQPSPSQVVLCGDNPRWLTRHLRSKPLSSAAADQGARSRRPSLLLAEKEGRPVPLVSVLIPAYNAESTIGESIAGVLAQTFTDWELIIVDDASTDGTFEVASAFAAPPRIRVLRNAERLGKWANHNRCAETARGTWLKFLHADDLLYPHALAMFISLAATRPDVGMAVSGASPLQAGTVLDPANAWRHEMVGAPLFMLSPTATLLRRETFLKAGGFEPARPCAQRHLALRLALRRPVLLAYPGLVSMARTHAYGLGCESVERSREICEAYAWFDGMLADAGCPLAAPERELCRVNLRRGVAQRGLALLRRGRVATLAQTWKGGRLPWSLLWTGLRPCAPGGAAMREMLLRREDV